MEWWSKALTGAVYLLAVTEGVLLRSLSLEPMKQQHILEQSRVRLCAEATVSCQQRCCRVCDGRCNSRRLFWFGAFASIGWITLRPVYVAIHWPALCVVQRPLNTALFYVCDNWHLSLLKRNLSAVSPTSHALPNRILDLQADGQCSTVWMRCFDIDQ